MEVKRIFVIFSMLILCIECVQCFVPLIPFAVAGISGIASVGYMSMCRFTECCTKDWIPANFSLLNDLLMEKFYGQHLAHKTVLYALQGHYKEKNPKKALVMSFHGSPGSGKNYLTSLIVEALFKKGDNSKYVRFYNSRLHFPSADSVPQYQNQIREEVKAQLRTCPRSVFIFDEVDKMPEGTLDILVPFVEYHSEASNVNTGQATFIFLSNAGSSEIIKQLTKLWQEGKKREDAQLQDFESVMSLGVFNENGGFHRSDVIAGSLIDHYVPFLPLEEHHVRQCVLDAFQKYDIVDPSADVMEEAMSYVTFGPPPHDLWSKSGCKRLLKKVSKIVQYHYHPHP